MLDEFLTCEAEKEKVDDLLKGGRKRWGNGKYLSRWLPVPLSCAYFFMIDFLGTYLLIY